MIGFERWSSRADMHRCFVSKHGLLIPSGFLLGLHISDNISKVKVSNPSLATCVLVKNGLIVSFSRLGELEQAFIWRFIEYFDWFKRLLIAPRHLHPMGPVPLGHVIWLGPRELGHAAAAEATRNED